METNITYPYHNGVFFLFLELLSQLTHATNSNTKHSKLDSYVLERQVWCYALQQEYSPNAHDSLVDCKTQIDIVLLGQSITMLKRRINY